MIQPDPMPCSIVTLATAADSPDLLSNRPSLSGAVVGARTAAARRHSHSDASTIDSQGIMYSLVRPLLAALFLAFPLPLLAQGELPVNIDVDHASFAYGEDQSLVEFYLAIDAASLDFTGGDQTYAARLPIRLEMVTASTAGVDEASEETVWADTSVLRFSIQDTSNISSGQHFIHQIRTAVRPGEYQLRLAVPANAEQGRPEVELRRDVLVPDYKADGEPALSDITLASEIAQLDDRESPFYKNGLVIRPNANLLYGQGLDRLFYYAEAYGTEEVAGADGEYTLYTYIAEANRPQPVAGLEKRLEREARVPDVIVGHFDLASLPSGSYFLRLAMLNEDNESVVEQSRKFFVYNPGVEREQPPAVEMDFETSPYATMTEEEVEQALGHIAVIANDTERRRIGRLEDLDSERRFLMDFWQKRDDSPTTPVNEFKEEFYRRVQYANDRYSSNRRPGWETDRGRAVIKYGFPSSIEPHLYDRDTAPHEIWHYNSIPGEGQATFVFADLNGFGEFELLHSSVPGERSIPNWEQELDRL